MNKNNVLGSFLLVVTMSAVLGFFLLYPINDVDLTNTQVNEPAVYTPEKELSKTEYGKKLIHILDLSRSDPLFADKALAQLPRLHPTRDLAIYKAYRLMILTNVAQHQQDTKAVMGYLDEINNLAEQEGMLWLKSQSLVESAIEYLKEGDLAASEIQIRSAIGIAESIRYDELLVKAYNTAGAINNVRNDLQDAQYFFHKGLQLGKKYPKHIYNSKLMSNMALLYIYLEDWPKALGILEKAKKLYFDSGLFEDEAIGILYINESFSYLSSGDLINGRIAYEKAEALNSDKVSNRYKILLLRAYSDVLLAEENFNAALSVTNLCLDSTGIEKYTLQNGQCYLNRALAKIGLNQDEVILGDLERAFAMFEVVGSRSWKVLALKTLGEYYESKGDLETALDYFKQYYHGNKALLFDKRQSDIFLLEQDYATTSLAQENELLNTEKDLNKLLLEKQQLRNRIVVALGIMVGISAVLLMVRLRTIQRTNDALLAQSTTCELTGLHNRRYLEKLLTRTTPFNGNSFGTSLAILDLDYFKQVNDTHGHDVGDQVLVEVARRIQQHLFSNDVVARWGGEEFVLLLSGSLAPQQQLDIIRLAIAQTPIDTPSGPLDITTSIGASVSIANDQLNRDTYKKHLKVADDALYQAKESGRNRVVCVASAK
ncbi:GGDEF domain-containing protein [Vibrio chagasii]|uniref:tetratricopeptide repeat-containing diguanylate cyclase n=1 Tax=Vibrio chagasii TaxID=170679 RepID=UPI0016417075|nr:GGDEF domain-containing protein [Vibrio chagasii]CAH6796448.1 GGDEF domain-containing protein [Vibrio chagasii]CAH6797514.1 Diguanylate cyclase [Vibrio chagasii]CAH6884624.1 GGDEF domain-containing protein [Vibrio chagasii]CAH6928462.1 GGDEF domain-containing protein [Vibrio chagasii]CAH6963365.1 GGDEF domain-containing protein [Vibrio chagasii]